MTISLKANAAGTQGEILLNGSTVETLTATNAQFVGQVESKATGFKFPDATVQASAALSAFIGSNHLLAVNGYQKLPGGLIIQWGLGTTPNGDGVVVNFPIPFPTAPLVMLASYANAASSPTCITVAQPTQFAGVVFAATPAGVLVASAFYWIAVGY